jgi:homoprotocatechuate degradation regulator HpaR
MRLSGEDVARARAAFRFPPFGKSLPMLLLAARESVMQRFRHQIQARGLTEQQWRVLRALAEVDSLEISALAARCHLLPASLSRILPKLNRDGLILRCGNAADQRRVIVSLTPGGRRLLEAARPDAERVYAQFARDIGPEQLEHVHRVLEQLIDALAETKPDKSPRRGRQAGRPHALRRTAARFA